MDIILEKKMDLSEILSAETAFILGHVHKNKLITDRDYSALKSLPQNTETTSGEVLDKLRDKGEDACQKFIDLLKQQCVLEQYPKLREVFSDLRQGPGVSAPATPPQDPDRISKYKTLVESDYENFMEYNSLPGDTVLLTDRYTELLIVETHRKQREREEEIRFRGEDHQQVLKTRASEAYNPITVDKLFKPDDGGKVPKAVILQGHSGHGKSFTAQKIMYDWASGKVFNLFDLVLHLKCKELNEISEAHSLVDLLSYCPSFTSQTAEVLKDSKMKVLFLIDGFDELKFSFEKTSTVPLKDPFTKALVEATLGALLKGLVLPKCFLLVTTRSTASDKLSKLLSGSQRFTDILGFTEEGVNEYFQRFFKEELLAKKAFDCVRTNETLYTACFIPVICWIICTVFREQEEEGLDINKELETTTSIFVHFVSILMKHHCQGLSQPAEETLLRSLGQLAERGLQEHQVLFDEKSLSEAFPDPSQATKYNPFLCKFLLRRKVKQESMYSFMHLSFQEFFAACQYLMLENEEEALKKLRVLFRNVEHFKAVVQFLFGLSNRGIDTHLIKQSRPSIKAYLQEWLLSVLENDRKHEEDLLYILHCLNELHEEEFVKKAMGVWGEIKFYSIPLTRTDCWELLYCLQCCSTIRSLELSNCNITAEKLRMLQPALSRCKELRLTVERLSDADVGDLISALGEGKILTLLILEESRLSPQSVEQVLSALSRQKSVGKVHLSMTTITGTNAALCLDFIQNTETCRHLRIDHNSSPPSSLSVDKDPEGFSLTVRELSDADVGVLISALGEGKILTELRVVKSSLSPESVELVLSALSRQKSVGEVCLSVRTFTGTTAALCLDFIQNTETCRQLRLKEDSWLDDNSWLEDWLRPEDDSWDEFFSLSSLSVKKDSEGLRLIVVNLSDADVVVLISALGEGKILTGLSVAQSSLSPESVEQVLSALSRQKSVGEVSLSVTTFTGTTAALCLDFIQNTETCRQLRLENDFCNLPLSSSSLTADKDSSGLRLTVERLSDADVGVLISALGEVKILTGLRVAESSLSHESLEQVLSALSRQKSVGKVHLPVTTITGSTAALCLDFMKKTETFRKLTLHDSSSPPSSYLYVVKDSRGLSLQGKSLLSPASLILSQANSPTSGSFTDFIHKFRDDTGLTAKLQTLPDLEKVELMVKCLTESWAHWILNLIHTCPTLKEVKLHTGFDEGLLLEEGISLLQESDKSPDCTVILIGRRCTKPSGKCGEEDEPKLDCNQKVKIQMRGSTVT